MELLEMTAKVLASENIMVSKQKVKTAAFDLKNRHLILPMWEGLEPIVEDMLVCHEVAHALFTPADFIKVCTEKPFLKSYVNVVEDARVEKLFKERYNGSRKSFVAGYKNLREADFFGIKEFNVNDMNLIDKINVFIKLGVLTGVKFTQKEYKFAERVTKVQTFEDVVALAEEIYEHTKNEKDEVQKELEEMRSAGIMDEEKEEFADDEDGDDDGDVWDDEDDWDTEEDEDADGDDDEDGDGSDTEEDEDGTEKSSSSKSKEKSEKQDDREDDEEMQEAGKSKGDRLAETEEPEKRDELESFTDKMLNNRLEEMTGFNTEPPLYIELDEDYTDTKFFTPYKDILKTCDSYNRHWNDPVGHETYSKFKNLSVKQINHLVQQFEMKKAADVYARRRIAKTGQIDVNKVAQYKIKEDIFRRQVKIPTGKNHGMIMLLDWSSSMYDKNNIRHSLDQVQMLVMFCRKVNIPYRVYAFASAHRQEKRNHCSGQLNLLEMFSSDMSLTEHNKMMEHTTSGHIMSCYSLSSTPLAPALLAMRQMIPQFKEATHCQKISLITFTDGQNGSRINTHPYYNGAVYFRDKVTKKHYAINDKSQKYCTDIKEVSAIYQLLKDRFDLTIISFFIGATSNLADAVRYSGNYSNAYDFAEKIKAEYTKNMFVKVVGFGRDAIYLLNYKMLVNKDFNTSGITGNMSSTKIATILKKSGKESLKGKILLEKFIETIA